MFHTRYLLNNRCFIAFLLFFFAGAEAARVSGDELRTFTVGNQQRSYLVHVPPNHDSK